MKWSFEIPIKYLHEFEDDLDYVFALAQYIDNKDYRNFLEDYKGEIILDNGAYELGESISIEKYWRVINLIRPDIVVIPDKLYDMRQSIILRNKFFYEKKEEELKDYFYMRVIQGSNIEDYLTSLKAVSQDSFTNIIGLSRTRGSIFGNSSAFFHILDTLGIGINKKIHLLGLVNPFELKLLNYDKERYFFNSIDTGLPINHAVAKEKLKDINRWKDYKHIRGVDIDYIGKLDIELAKENINYLKSLVE